MNKRRSTLELGFAYLNGNLPARGTRLLGEALKRDGRLRKDLTRLALLEELLREARARRGEQFALPPMPLGVINSNR